MPHRDITEKHRRLAEITEMIHTASLMHDDVVDESPVRRGVLSTLVCVKWAFLWLSAEGSCMRCAAGKMTVNSRFGTKVAVLAGDFLFAQSSWFLANLDNLEVCSPRMLADNR